MSKIHITRTITSGGYISLELYVSDEYGSINFYRLKAYLVENEESNVLDKYCDGQTRDTVSLTQLQMPQYCVSMLCFDGVSCESMLRFNCRNR